MQLRPLYPNSSGGSSGQAGEAEPPLQFWEKQNFLQVENIFTSENIYVGLSQFSLIFIIKKISIFFPQTCNVVTLQSG